MKSRIFMFTICLISAMAVSAQEVNKATVQSQAAAAQKAKDDLKKQIRVSRLGNFLA